MTSATNPDLGFARTLRRRGAAWWPGNPRRPTRRYAPRRARDTSPTPTAHPTKRGGSSPAPAPRGRDRGTRGQQRPGTAQLVQRQATFALLIVEARSITSRRQGSVTCRFPPGDVAADHAALFAVAGVVGAAQGEGRASNVGFSLPRSVCPEEMNQEDAQAGDEAEGSAHDAHHEQGMSLQQANEPVGGFGGCVRRHVGAPVPIALRSACRAPMGGDGWTVIARDALGPYDTTRRGRPWDPALADLLRSNDKAPSSWTTL